MKAQHNKDIEDNSKEIRTLNIISRSRVINIMNLISREKTEKITRKGSYYFYNENKKTEIFKCISKNKK